MERIVWVSQISHLYNLHRVQVFQSIEFLETICYRISRLHLSIYTELMVHTEEIVKHHIFTNDKKYAELS